MALIVKRTERFNHPTEPGTWFDVRLPLTAGDMAGMRSDGKTIGMTLDLLTAMIQGWSYDAPVTLANVESLDLDTFAFLSGAIMGASGIRDDDSKNESGGSSPQASVTPEPSLASSGT